MIENKRHSGDTVFSFGFKEVELLAKITRILDRGNNAQVKRGKNGLTVMEVKKTIID